MSHSTVPSEEPSADGGLELVLEDDDALLFDALAFIGDFELDADDATPDEDDELPWPFSSDALLSPSAAITDPVLPPSDAHVQQSAPTEWVAPCAENATESDACTTAAMTEERVDIHEGSSAKPKSINRSRTRRREELAYLRDLVGELENRLTSLRSRQGEEVSDANAATSPSDESTELVDAWAQLASRQYEQRQRAEMENSKLKRLLQEQIQVGKSLERLLRRKRPSLEAFDAGIAAEKRLRRSNSRSSNDTFVFDELLAQCDELYAQTDRALTKFGTTPVKPQRDIKLVHDPELGMMLQTLDHRILPFIYEDTVNVVWSSFPEVSTVHRTHSYHDVDLTDDTIKLQFRVVADIGRAHGEVNAKVAIRRYVEANRTVVITSGIIDPSEISQTSMAGVRMRQSGWHVIERIPPSHSNPQGTTRILIYLRAVPEVDDDLRDQTRKVGTLTNFLLTTLSVEIESCTQMVDNRLLEVSLAGDRVSA